MATATQPAKTKGTHPDVALRIYTHSPILYWWPVWAVGFLMALWTVVDDYHLLAVPAGTVVEGNQVIAPEGVVLDPPSVHIARSRVPGEMFVFTLLFVVICSHLWMRGVWALFTAAVVAAVGFMASWLHWWGPLGHALGVLRIYINLGGYVVLSTVLFIAWVLAVFVFDRRTYLIFQPGQVRVRDELGDAEKVFDTWTVTFEKKPYDWFRWLVGIGAGDIVLRTGGAHPQIIELPNVVRVGKRLAAMQVRMRTRDVV